MESVHPLLYLQVSAVEPYPEIDECSPYPETSQLQPILNGSTQNKIKLKWH